MTIWLALLIIFGAGVVGGLANALMADKGFQLPKKEGDLLLPGALGGIFVSGIAAVVLWGLYSVIGQQPLTDTYTLTLTEIIGGLVAGLGGARVLTAEIDKAVLRQTAANAAILAEDTSLVTTIQTKPPVDALRAVKSARATYEQAMSAGRDSTTG